MDNEESNTREYISALKKIKTEVGQILSELNQKEIFRASKHYPERLNRLLTERNIKSVRGLFPFMDLAFIKKRKDNLELVDLNSPKKSAELLQDVIRRIDRELTLQ